MRIHNFYRTVIYSVIFFLLLFTGCGGGGGSSSGDPTDTTDNIQPVQAQIEFQETVLDHFQDKVLTVQNQGSASVNIKSVAQSDPLADPFLITDDQCTGTTLAPSGTCAITVRFSPATQGTFTDTFDIKSDSDQTIMLVDVSGTSVGLNVSINRIDTGSFPTVRVFVSVTDRNDDPVDSLTADDFQIFENDELKSIDTISNTIAAPVSAALVLDSSSSIQLDLTNIENAAKAFVDQLSLNLGTDEASIIKFAATSQIKQSFTDDYDSLISAIGNPYTGDITETHLYDVLWQAVDMASDPARNEKRAVIVITDGHDEGSVNHTLSEVIDYANAKGVPIFTIGLSDIFIYVLQQLADETGGQYFVAPTSDDLQGIYTQIAYILTNQYVIEYQSSASDGGSIDLAVDVTSGNYSGSDEKTVTGF